MNTPTFTCATCDTTIGHAPVFHLGLAFCCPGCAADGPCSCSYDAEPVVADPVAIAEPVRAATTPTRVAAPSSRPVEVAVPAPAAVRRTAPAAGTGAALQERPLVALDA